MFELTPFDRRNHRHLAEFDPFRGFADLEKEFFGRSAEFGTDIRDNGKEFVLEADLPGFDKDNIHVDVDGSYLTISAERSSENSEKDKKGNYVRRERSYGSYSRSFDISNVNAEKIDVAYKDGVLTLVMPKKDAALPASRRLQIR